MTTALRSSTRLRLSAIRSHATIYFAACLLLLGMCEIEPTSLPVDRDEVIGLYVANYKAGLVETIELRGDSTYTYYFLAKDSTEYTIENTWGFHYDMGSKRHPSISLDEFLAPYPLDGLCYCEDCPDRFVHRDTLPYAYFVSVYKNGKEPIVLRRCPPRNQKYVKVGF